MRALLLGQPPAPGALAPRALGELSLGPSAREAETQAAAGRQIYIWGREVSTGNTAPWTGRWGQLAPAQRLALAFLQAAAQAQVRDMAVEVSPGAGNTSQNSSLA